MQRIRLVVMTRHERGFTLVELLVVIVVVSILATFSAFVIRPRAEVQAANSFQALVQEARLEGVKRNRPVAVVWDLSAQEALVAIADATSPDCTTNLTQIDTFDLSEYRDVSVTTTLGDDGLLWFPSGRGQSCAASSLDSTTTFSAVGRQALVVMSSGGRIEVQR